MRIVVTTGLLAMLVGLGGPAEASFYTCTDKRGNTWVTNYKVKGARCRLAIKTPKPKPQPKPKPEVAATAPVIQPQAQPQPQIIYQNAPAPAPIIIYRDGPAPTNSAQIIMPPERAQRPRHSQGSAADEPRDRAGRERLYAPYVEEAAHTYDLPEAFLQAVIRVESDFKYRAKRKDGARGLMQLSPTTTRALRVEDPFDPRANVLAGARALRELANRYEGDFVQVLAAYRGADDPGDNAADRYVRSVLDHYYAYKTQD